MVADNGALAAHSLYADTINVNGAGAAPEPVTVVPPLGLRDPSRPLRGRDVLLQHLESALSSGDKRQIQVLCGMGGCGKTSLALEIAHRRTSAGHRVWWIDARQDTTLEAGFRAVARHAGATEEQLSAGDAVDVLWACLSQLATPWLLVVDNADDPALLDGPGSLRAGTGWLRPHASLVGSVLITTRDSNAGTWGSMCALHPVHPLSGDDKTADAVQILLDHATAAAGTADDARRLATRLGGLPLALRLAGTYLAEANQVPPAYRDPAAPTDFSSYLKALDEDLRRADPSNVIHQTWAMSMDLLEQRGDVLARPLLQLITTFADAPLPYTLLLTPATLADAGELAELDGPGLWKLLTALASLGLLDLAESNAEPGTLPTARVHPLVRDATRSPMSLGTAISAMYSAAVADVTGIPEEPAYWDCWRLLQPHALYLFHRARTAALSSPITMKAAEAAGLAARYLLVRGLYHQARPEFEAVLALRRKHLGENHRGTLDTRHALASVLRHQGELGVARTEYEAVLALRRKHLGESHRDTLTTRHELASVMGQQGERDAARTEYEAILALRREHQGETHPHTLTTRHNFASLLSQEGELDAARTEYEAILALRREHQGETHPHTLTTRHNLASLLRQEGELDAARTELEAVLALRRKHLGETHPHTLSTRHELASLLRQEGELDAARTEYEAVLALRRKHLGETHPRTLTTRHNFASLLRQEGELDAARTEYEAVLALRREHQGETHPHTLTARHSLALVLREQGELDAARSEFEAVLALRREHLGENHPDTIRTRTWVEWLDAHI
ncbi:FxSxx-COOH system tetratricopeptide repeat protein [Streptomyces canus]|uniref:FxSxx-COOH system tetratricopeptide repeat protein n=1 Tax=Streptomyces canus TaxID=58343 RepID=UPI0030E5E7C3